MKRTLVIGASTNEQRYSNMAVKSLINHGHELVAFGAKSGQINTEPITTNFPKGIDFDTVTLYVNPISQEQYIDQILALQPKRIIFNPGTENPILEEKAAKLGIETLNACTLVLLSTNQY